MNVFVIILFTIMKFISAQRCKPVSCVNRGDTICYNPNVSSGQVLSVELSQCTYGQMCTNFNNDKWTSNKNQIQCTHVPIEFRNSHPINRPSDRVENDHCTTDSACASGSCESSRCVGVNNGDPCNSNNACIWSNYCNSNSLSCEVRKRRGESCTEDRDCLNTAACDINNTCTNLASIKSGLSFKGSEAFCKSGFAVNGICENFSYYPCDPETQTSCTVITSVSSTILQYGNCICNPNGSPYGICTPVEPTNAIWDNYLQTFRELTSMKCAYMASTSCTNIPIDAYKRFKFAEAAALGGYDIDNYYCFISSSNYLRFSLALLSLLVIII